MGITARSASTTTQVRLMRLAHYGADLLLRSFQPSQFFLELKTQLRAFFLG